MGSVVRLDICAVPGGKSATSFDEAHATLTQNPLQVLRAVFRN
jgi:hypothetical protein